jgi:hypothetical protein
MTVTHPEPLTYEQARNSPDSDKWDATMRNEITVLEKSETFKLVPLPDGKRTVDAK